jgi:hypothetical protein
VRIADTGRLALMIRHPLRFAVRDFPSDAI